MRDDKGKSMNSLKNRWKTYIVAYIFFIIAAIGIHLYFVKSGVYFNEYCCDSFKQISHFYPFLQREFSDGNFFWSWQYGLGGDIFAEFLYYYSTNPFFWLSMLFTIDSLQVIFEYRIYISVVKLALAMIFMFHLFIYLQRNPLSSVLSSLVYGGSIFYIFYSFRYDFLIDGMVLLPLLIWSFEYYTDKNKPIPFTLMVALLLTTNFYLAFINSIYLGLYAIYKYFILHEKITLKHTSRYFLKFGLFYIIGIGISAFSFLPAINTYLKVDRFYYELEIPLVFHKEFYTQFFYKLFFMTDLKFQVVFPIIVLFLIPIGVLIREKYFVKRYFFTLFIFVLVLIPFVYSMFNGFSVIQYRWLYLFIFTIAWICPFILDYIIDHKQKSGATVLLIVLQGIIPLLLVLKAEITGIYVDHLDLWILFYSVCICLLLLLLIRHTISSNILMSILIGIVLLNTVTLNTAFFNKFLHDPQVVRTHQDMLLTNYASEQDRGLVSSVKETDSSFYRILWNDLSEFNAPMLLDYNGFSAYSSLISGNVHRFMKQDYNILHWNAPSLFQNLDNRLYLETTLANKYYISPKDTDSEHKPFGYSLFSETEQYFIYENDYSLPIGFMYNFVIEEDVFQKLHYAERDQLMLHAAVVPSNNNLNLPTFDPTRLQVQHKTIDLNRIELANVERVGSHYSAKENAALIISNPLDKESGEIVAEIEIQELNSKPFDITINNKIFKNLGENRIYNYPRKKIVINTGDWKDTVTIYLSPGDYKIKDILLSLNSYSPYKDLVSHKQSQSLQDIEVTEQSVKGTITNKEDGILFLSIPFSKGWSATVNGMPVELIEVNGAFTGIHLQKGKSIIELQYQTPLFETGWKITLISLISLMSLLLFRKKKVNTL
jgi:uncharacterized membrane protein YfhO